MAVHASVCDECLVRLGALDALDRLVIDAGGVPPARVPPGRGSLVLAWIRRGTAVTGAVVAGALVVLIATGVTQFAGRLDAGAAPSPSEGVVLGGLSSGDQAPSPQDSALGTLEPAPAAAPAPSAQESEPAVAPEPSAPALLASTPPQPTPGPPVAATPAPTPVPECNDGIDNDNDGATDLADLECSSVLDTSEAPFTSPECNDGLDNDSDGFTDVVDPGCGGDPFGTAELPVNYHECNDGVDNDFDGFTDLADQECGGGPFGDSEGPR
jgi:hypothetical protein